MVTPLVRPGGVLRNFDEAQAVFSDVLEVQYLDRSAAGEIFIGTVNATKITLGGVATAVEIPGTMTLLDSSTLIVNSGSITLGDNDGDSITLGGGTNDSVTLSADMTLDNGVDIRFPRGGPGTGVLALPDASVGEVGAIRVDASNNFQWWNGSSWSTAGAATGNTLQLAYEAGSTITTNATGTDLQFTVSTSGDFQVLGLLSTYWNFEYTGSGLFVDANVRLFRVSVLEDLSFIVAGDAVLAVDDDVAIAYGLSSLNGEFEVSNNVSALLTMDQAGQVLFTPASGEDFIVTCTGTATGAMDFSTNDANIDIRAGVGAGTLGTASLYGGQSVEIAYDQRSTTGFFRVSNASVTLSLFDAAGAVIFTPESGQNFDVVTGGSGYINLFADNIVDIGYDQGGIGGGFRVANQSVQVAEFDDAGQITFTPASGEDFLVTAAEGEVYISVNPDTASTTRNLTLQNVAESTGSFDSNLYATLTARRENAAVSSPNTKVFVLATETHASSNADVSIEMMSTHAGAGDAVLDLVSTTDGAGDARNGFQAVSTDTGDSELIINADAQGASGAGFITISAASANVFEAHTIFMGRGGGYGGMYLTASYSHATETARWLASVNNAGGGPSLCIFNVNNSGGANSDFEVHVDSANGSTCTALVESRDHIYLNHNNGGAGAGDFEVQMNGSTTIKSSSVGAVSVTPASNQHFSVTAAGTGEIQLTDGHLPGSWSLGYIPLSSSAAEWVTFESAFGEVSLLNAIAQTGAVGWVATADEAISSGQAVCGALSAGTDDRVNVANADSTATGRQHCIGIALTAAVGAASTLRLGTQGLVSVICPSGESWTKGDAIFLDDVAGQVSNVPPAASGDVVQQVGWAAETNSTGTARTMFVSISKVIPIP